METQRMEVRKKTGILNKDLWMLLDGLQKKLDVAWRWVEGHRVGVSESSCFWQQRALDIVGETGAPEPSTQSKLEEVKVCSFCNKETSEKNYPVY